MDENYKRLLAERKQRELDRAPKSWWWLGQRDPTARFTLWLVIFTGLLAMVSGLQWGTIRDQLDEMKNDQRAWLGAADFTYEIKESGSIKGAIQVLNTGRTPAMGVTLQMGGATKRKSCPLTTSEIIYPSDMPILKQGTIFPNQHFPLGTNNLVPMEPTQQKAYFDNIKIGVWIQYFFGYIQYRDDFGNDHWTHFCSKYVPETNSGTPCEIYNNTDDDKRKDTASKPSASCEKLDAP